MSKTIAIITAMHSELRPLLRHLSLNASTDNSYDYYGYCNDILIIALVSKMGTQAASIATQKLLENNLIDHVFIVGVAGGVNSIVSIGELIIPETVIDKKTKQQYQPKNLTDKDAYGKLSTSDDLKYDSKKIAELNQQNIIAVDMETASIAAVCHNHRCPFSVFRAISDYIEPDAVDYDAFHLANADGSPNLLAVVKYLITKPWKIGYLINIGLGANKAIKTSTNAAIKALNNFK